MSAFHKFLVALGLAMPSKENASAAIKSVTVDAATDVCTTELSDTVMPFDEHLLDRARTQWQFGDWKALATLPEEQIQAHPSRNALLVLKAAGLMQSSGHSDSLEQAREILRDAMQEGATRENVLRALVAGVHNNLGMASLIAGRGAQPVLTHFDASHRIGRPGVDTRLTLESSLKHQLRKLSVGPSDAALRGLQIGLAEHQSLPTGRVATLANSGTGSGESLLAFNFSIDGIRTKLEFFSKGSRAYRVEDDRLHFDFAAGDHGYLLTVESGSLDTPPQANHFSLHAGYSYELSGFLEGKFTKPAQIWALQYSPVKKLQGNNVRCEDGQFRLVFHADPFASRGGIGIRLSGSGFICLEASRLCLKTNSVAALGSVVEDQVSRLKKDVLAALDKQQSKQAKQSLAQLESFVRLQTYMGQALLLPDMHGWPISPDFGVLVVRLLEATEYDLVVEFGSGSSTVIVAETLHRRAQKSGLKARFASFEHLEVYRDKTAALLREAEHESWVELTLAPLRELMVSAEPFSYYDPEVSGALLGSLSPKRVFVLVDGPPASTGPKARLPAFFVLSGLLPSSELHFLMDDYGRDDEREIIDRWQDEAKGGGYEVEKVEYKDLEKQACLLKLRPAHRSGVPRQVVER